MATTDLPAQKSAINTPALPSEGDDSNRDAGIRKDCNLQSGRDAWQSAVATWREAQATSAAHPYRRTRPGRPDYERMAREAADLAGIEGRALDAVMDMIAPDHAAVIEKLEIIQAEFSDDFYIDRLIADVRRLGSRAIWDTLMARYLAAKAEEDNYAERVHDPMFEDNPCTDSDERKAVADEMERLQGIRCDLRNQLIGATAPDEAALLWKLEWLLSDRENMCWSDATIDPIQRDVRRLLAGEA